MKTPMNENAAARPNEKTPIQNRIRRLRFDHDEMTQQELADCVGVTRQTILAIEAAKYNPSLLVAMRIARVFGAKVDDVFTLAPEGPAPAKSAPPV